MVLVLACDVTCPSQMEPAWRQVEDGEVWLAAAAVTEPNHHQNWLSLDHPRWKLGGLAPLYITISIIGHTWLLIDRLRSRDINACFLLTDTGHVIIPTVPIVALGSGFAPAA